MKSAIITAHDDNYRLLADLTWHKNRKFYAQKHGYHAIAREVPKLGLHANFQKIDLMLEIFTTSDIDVMLWTDTDSMITNFNVPLDDLLYAGYDITIATDWNGINSGTMLLRKSPRLIAYLQAILANEPRYKTHEFYEQGYIMDTYNQHRDMIKIVPQRFMNAYWLPIYHVGENKDLKDQLGFSGQWRPGDFIIHAPGQPQNMRISLFEQIFPRVIM